MLGWIIYGKRVEPAFLAVDGVSQADLIRRT